MKVKLIMATPEELIGNCAKVCYANTAVRDITHSLIHERKHLSALRFAYATVFIEGISVACQNQIVRSSHLDYMVQSKRYVNPDKGGFEFIMPDGLDDMTMAEMDGLYETSLTLYKALVEKGVKKEDARAILPMNTSTKMYVTGNLQGWYSFFKLRLQSHAQTEIRNVANTIYKLLAEAYPQVFTDGLHVELSEHKGI